MPQIIRKERTPHLASYTFLQEMLIKIKTLHFHSSINNQERLFEYLRILQHRCFPVKLGKFLRRPFLTKHLQ